MASPSPRMGAGSSASSQPDEVVAASLDEPHSKTGHGETAVVRKAPVKVIWAAATHDAVLDIRYDAARSEAWLALRFPNIVLREQGNVSFFVAFAPEDIESLRFLEEGAAYHLVVQLRQPPGIVGPDCTWTDPELFGPGTLTVQQLQTLGLETSCTLSVPAKEAKKTQLKLFCETISKGSTRSLKRYYNTASLYRGKGGRRFGATEAWCPPSYAQVGAGGGNSVSASAKAISAEALPTYGAIAATESIQGQEQATMRPPKRPRRSMSTEDPPEHPPCPMCEDVKATMNKKMDDIMSQLAQLTEVNRRLNERVEESALTVASLNERINGLETLVATHTQEHEAEVSEKLQDEVLAIMRDEFVEKEDLEYTVATEVDIEIDTASKYIEEKLKEELLEYVNEEMEGKEDEIIETILDRIGSARVHLEF